MKKWFEHYGIIAFFAVITILVSVQAYKYFSKQQITIGFYHWKKDLNLVDKEEEAMSSSKNTPLYLRCFDVDWDEERAFIIPRSSLKITKPLSENTPVTPVVFLSNHIFEAVPDSQMTAIVEIIWLRLAQNISQIEDSGAQISGIQFDCDWTLSTKDKYFKFLEVMSNYASFDLSATIRLHQVKYAEKTGVPPVKRGMLMFYNMGDLDNPNTKNSILDLETAKLYVEHCKNYTLPLDIALPLFQWAVVTRDGRVVQLLNAANTSDFADEEMFQKLENGQYKALESTYVHGYFCYENDIIRLENASQEQLEAAATMLSNYLPKERRTLCFYHLDNIILQNHPYKELKKIQENME
jgi:hypothetical protein